MILGLLAAAGNVIGAVVVVRHLRRGLQFIEALIAFGAGFMLAVVLVGILPEVFHGGAVLPGVFVFAGYFGVHLSQHVLTQHFHYGVETHRVAAKAGTSAPSSASRSTPSSTASPSPRACWCRRSSACCSSSPCSCTSCPRASRSRVS